MCLGTYLRMQGGKNIANAFQINRFALFCGAQSKDFLYAGITWLMEKLEPVQAQVG